MTETYSSAVWTVKPDEEDDFVKAWEEFVRWAADMPGSGTFRLVRDLQQPDRFLSMGSWESVEAQQAWQERPDFAERLGRPRSHCADFQPAAYEFVTDVA
jgi:heme-degrading monooxygenase HmoA